MASKQMELNMAIQTIRDAKDARFGVIETESAVELLTAYDAQSRLIAEYQRELLSKKDMVIQNATRKAALDSILTKAKKIMSVMIEEGKSPEAIPIRELVQIADKGART